MAAGYGDAELRLGPWMPRIRDQIFLATKTGERDREAAWRQINASLERLQTDKVDLLQLHAVGDLERARPGHRCRRRARGRAPGAGRGARRGRRHHRPRPQAPATHLEALRRHPFATVLTPLNPVLWRDDAYRADYVALVEEVRRQDVGLMTIKTVARRNWPRGAEQAYSTWYEPCRRPSASGRRLVGARPRGGHRAGDGR